jgi:hypothetical protein
MINWIRKFFIKTPYVCCMELHNILECYLSLKIPSIGPIEGFRGFFHENHFMIGHRMFDPEWDNKIQLEEIYKKLLMVYDFNPKDENLIIVRGEQKIYIPERKFYVPLPPDGVFVYDKSKLKVYCRCN